MASCGSSPLDGHAYRFTPRLAESICKGHVISQLEIELTATYGMQAEPVAYLRYELKDVHVVSYNVPSGDQRGGLPVEEVGLAFEEIRVIHTEYDESGLSGASTEFSWKVEKGGVVRAQTVRLPGRIIL